MFDMQLDRIKPVDQPAQFDRPQLSPGGAEADSLVRAPAARAAFRLDGAGLSMAVADTGLNIAHADFAERVLAVRNFTAEHGGDPSNVTDGNGHGTNVTGIAAAGLGDQLGDHLGIAPGAGIVPLKVLSAGGGAGFHTLELALQWTLDHAERYAISTVCLAFGDGENYADDAEFSGLGIVSLFEELRAREIAVCATAGTDYYKHASAQGMAFPGVLRECVAVGAVYDADDGPLCYWSGAAAHRTAADRLTPYSQRLHAEHARHCCTDIFAPGGTARSAGIRGAHGESVQHGMSQATPVVAGVLMLMQQYHLRETGVLPEVDELVTWMRRSAVRVFDGDARAGNVTPSYREYPRLDAVRAIDAIRRALERRLYAFGQVRAVPMLAPQFLRGLGEARV